MSDEQPGIGSNGFPEIFTASMLTALEWGMELYSKELLDNWLTYFIRDHGFIQYRGLEMSEHARMLTLAAQHLECVAACFPGGRQPAWDGGR